MIRRTITVSSKLVRPYHKSTSIKRKSNSKVKPNSCFSRLSLLYWQECPVLLSPGTAGFHRKMTIASRCQRRKGLRNMHNVDILIELIREHRNQDALDMLDASPTLATMHTDRSGQLHGASPLHWAAHRNAPDVCARLIELGANVNDSASDWWQTPLSWGADAGSAEAVELLLKHGADVNQDAIVGTTALHAAAMGGSSQGKGNPQAYQRTAEILISHGADINRRTNKYRTPLDEAIDNANESVITVLQKHGAQISKNSD